MDLKELYDAYLLNYYRNRTYETFLFYYEDFSYLGKKMQVVQINDIYLATRAETVKSGMIEVYLWTENPMILRKIEYYLERDRQILSHQPEDGYVSYSKDFDNYMNSILTGFEHSPYLFVKDFMIVP